MELLDKLEKAKTDPSNNKPIDPIVIVDCGEITKV